MAGLPDWRRTGRSAQAGHLEGLKQNVCVEFPGYDNIIADSKGVCLHTMWKKLMDDRCPRERFFTDM